MTSYKDDQEDISHGASQLEPQRLAVASTTTPINKPGGATAQETPQILGPVAATTRESSKMANQTDAQGNTASGSKADGDTEKQVFFIRHQLQRTMLSREQLAQEEDIPAVSDEVKWLEDHHIDADIVRRTKINKVLKTILKLNSIPRDDEFDIRARCGKLIENYTEMLLQN